MGFFGTSITTHLIKAFTALSSPKYYHCAHNPQPLDYPEKAKYNQLGYSQFN
jgi:hypothetical protein